jgi:hypothetical protein
VSSCFLTVPYLWLTCVVLFLTCILLFFVEALILKPEDKNCFVARSRCYLKMGDTDNALSDAETSLKEDKEFFKVRLNKR